MLTTEVIKEREKQLGKRNKRYVARVDTQCLELSSTPSVLHAIGHLPITLYALSSLDLSVA